MRLLDTVVLRPHPMIREFTSSVLLPPSCPHCFFSAPLFPSPHHQVLGDRTGVLRWWDVTRGHCEQRHLPQRGAVRRICFSPCVVAPQRYGRVAVLFQDHSLVFVDLVG